MKLDSERMGAYRATTESLDYYAKLDNKTIRDSFIEYVLGSFLDACISNSDGNKCSVMTDQFTLVCKIRVEGNMVRLQVDYMEVGYEWFKEVKFFTLNKEVI